MKLIGFCLNGLIMSIVVVTLIIANDQNNSVNHISFLNIKFYNYDNFTLGLTLIKQIITNICFGLLLLVIVFKIADSHNPITKDVFFNFI